jgi:putative thioredoxin
VNFCGDCTFFVYMMTKKHATCHPSVSFYFSHAGKIVLAKLNIENEGVQSLVQSLQIASVPTLFLIMQGRIVDVVNGVPPPAELQSWVAKAVSVMATIRSAEDERPKLNENAAADPKAQLGAGYEALRTSGTRSQNIAPQFADILDSASALPEHKAAATAGLAICAVLEGNLETAAELVASATALAGETASEDVSAAEAWLDLAKEAAMALKNESRTAEEIESHMLANKKDASAAYLLALKLFQDVRLSEAVDAALQIVRRDREWQDQAGRRVVTALCHVLGSSSEGAKAARRRLSNLWFL